jgi:superfamily II DNA/RNA helicase
MTLHGIQVLRLHGSLSAAVKDDVLEQFKKSGVDGPRVLIVSDVGLTGLNLPCANIMVIVVRLFRNISSCIHFPTHSPEMRRPVFGRMS